MIPIDDPASQPSPRRLALFDAAFRPFFLAAAGQAVVSVLIWVALWGGIDLLPHIQAPMLWHSHEMLFGFVGAAVAGFLLTAIPNWTKWAGPTAGRLKALVALWLAGRVMVWLGGIVPWGLAAAVDMAFLAVLAAVIAAPLRRSGKGRNFVFVALLLGLIVANGLMHLDLAGLAETGVMGQSLAIALIVLMIGLLGGRIIPGFTRNGLAAAGKAVAMEPVPALDRAALASLAAAGAALVIAPDGVIAAALLVAAGLINLARLATWRGWKCLGLPLIWVLHAAYLFLAVGLVLRGMANVVPVIPASAALHGLTAGTMGMMILGVMSRAALGHSGRPLVPSRLTIVAYGMVGLGALMRMVLPILAPDLPAIEAAGLLWSGGFLAFIIAYWKVLTQPRIT